MSDFRTAREFAQFIKGLGFRAFVAGGPGGDGVNGYGFITDAQGSRVMCFGMRDGNLGGTYGPPTQESGTGWRMDETMWDLKTADDVRKALYMPPPEWARRGPSRCGSCGASHGRAKGWEYPLTLAQYQAQYQSSSKFEEV